MFEEDDLLPISALQHLVYCERQAALIHVERIWSESAETVEGRHLHDTAHEASGETRGGVRVVRALALRSLELGLAGVADVVEFRKAAEGAVLPGREGRWIVVPVEYKRGRPKRHRADEIQLCAQALCLEEMYASPVPVGALFYGKTRRRKHVVFDAALRELTRSSAESFRRIVTERRTPLPRWGPKCRRCSLLDDCQPRAPQKSARRYLIALLQHASDLP